MNELLRYKNILVAAVIIGVFGVIIYSIYSHYTSQLNDINAQFAELAQGRQTIAKWDALERQYRELGQVFLSKDVTLFKQYMEEKAQATDIPIESLSMSREDQGYYWKASIRLQGICTYKNFVEFLKLLEEKKILLEQITLEGVEESGGLGSRVRIEASFQGVILK